MAASHVGGALRRKRLASRTRRGHRRRVDGFRRASRGRLHERPRDQRRPPAQCRIVGRAALLFRRRSGHRTAPLPLMIDPGKVVEQSSPPAPRADAAGRLLGAAIFGLAFGFLLQKGGVAKYHVLIGALLLEDWTVAKVIL